MHDPAWLAAIGALVTAVASVLDSRRRSGRNRVELSAMQDQLQRFYEAVGRMTNRGQAEFARTADEVLLEDLENHRRRKAHR